MGRSLVCAVALAAAGCGGRPLYPVEGAVTFDGRPLADGDVVFHPDDGSPAPADRMPPANPNDIGQSSGSRACTPGGVQFALCDGSVRFVPASVDLPTYRAAATRRKNEALPLP